MLLDLLNSQIKELIVMLAGNVHGPASTARRVLGWTTKSRRDLDAEGEAGVLKLCSLLERIFEHGLLKAAARGADAADGTLSPSSSDDST